MSLVMGVVTQDLPFMGEVAERKPGFLKQLKAFMKETDGGAVPVSVAVAALGYTRHTIYRLIEREKETPGTGLRAWKFNNTILVCGKDIDRLADQEKRKPGRPKKVG